MGKVIIFSAPSGAGKSTIVNYLLEKGLGLEFSISATCRAPRGKEIHGKEYYFFTADEFRKRIENKEFLEWEEVYPGCYYGTLLSEIDRIWAKGHTVLFDVDVVGGLNIKKKFGDNALSIFIQPPSVEYEMTFADKFDTIIVNDKLEEAFREAEKKVRDFLK